MRKRFFSILQYIFFLGGGILLVWWQLRSMTEAEWSDFRNALGLANYWLILPVIILMVLSHVSRAMRWKLLLETLDYHPALKNVFAVLMIGYMGNAAVPRLGEVLKCTFLSKYEKLHFDKLFGTILVERAFDFLCFLIFIGITVLIQIDLIGSYVMEKVRALSVTKMLVVLACVVVVFYFVKYLFRKHPENRIIFKVNKFFNGIIEGFKTIKKLKKYKQFLAHTFLIWTMYLLQVYIGFYVMEETAHLGIKPAFSVLTLATLAMIATPGGIGSFPIFVTETLLIYGILFPVGNAFGWLLWGVNTGIVILLGVGALLALPIINKSKHEVSSVNPV